MKTGAAVVVLGVAAGLGTLTGVAVLPDRDMAGSGSSSPSPSGPASTPNTSVSPTPSASPSPAVSPTPTGPEDDSVTADDLLTTADVRAAGLEVGDWSTSGRLELTSCTGDADQPYRRTTLAEVAVSGPPVQRLWSGETDGASEEAVTLKVEEEATAAVGKIVRIFASCQERPPGYWVYGPTHTERLGPQTTVTWLGSVDGELNQAGRAPEGAGINGGVAVLRDGVHVAVLSVNWCQSAGDEASCVVAPGDPEQQIATLSRKAARRLG